MSEILKITSARPVESYVLDVTFSDGTKKRVNIEPLLWGPVFEPVRDPDHFKQVFVDDTLKTVAWPSGADLAPEALHELPEVEMAGR